MANGDNPQPAPQQPENKIFGLTVREWVYLITTISTIIAGFTWNHTSNSANHAENVAKIEEVKAATVECKTAADDASTHAKVAAATATDVKKAVEKK